MDLFVDNLALAGSPVQWGLLGFVVVMMFAPRLLPPLARLAARMLGIEVRRRLGMPPEPPTPRRTSGGRRPEIEVLPPERPVAGLHTQPFESPPLRTASRVSPVAPRLWPVALVVAGAVAVLLWLLLRAR